ncbi:hypothetical protein D3C85_1885660 [compost metagenome]
MKTAQKINRISSRAVMKPRKNELLPNGIRLNTRRLPLARCSTSTTMKLNSEVEISVITTNPLIK